MGADTGAETIAVAVEAIKQGATYQARSAYRHHGTFPLAGAILANPLRSRVRRFESYWGRFSCAGP